MATHLHLTCSQTLTARLTVRSRAIALLVLGQFVSGVHGAVAQTVSFGVGPMIGVSHATWRGSDVSGPTRSRTGSVEGAFFTITIHKYFTIEPQIFYVRKGTELTLGPCGPAASCPSAVDYSQGYVEVPLLLTGTLPMSGRIPFAPTIFAGPAVAFQTSCTETPVSPPLGVPSGAARCDSLYAGFGAAMKHRDALLVFGGGVNVGPLALLARYDLGLTKLIVTGVTVGREQTEDVKTKAWLMSAGVRLPFGRQ